MGARYRLNSPNAMAPKSMPGPMTWTLFRRMALAILCGGGEGIIVGVCAGAAMGVFVYIIGAIFGAIIAIPFGFLAGLIGKTLGGRLGWAIGGASALFFPLFIYAQSQSGHSDGSFWQIASLVGLIYGGLIGIWYGKRSNDPNVPTGRPGDWAQTQETVALYDIPLCWRILALTAVVSTILGVIWDAYRFLNPSMTR